METKMIVNETGDMITIMPISLKIKAEQAWMKEFYIPEYLFENMKVADLPDGYSFVPYELIDFQGNIRTNHPSLEITKLTDNEANVEFTIQVGHEIYYPYLGAILYPTLKRDLVLKKTLYKPEVTQFEIVADGKAIDFRYSIPIKGNTVKEVIQAAAEFDESIELELEKVLSQVETTCRSMLGIE